MAVLGAALRKTTSVAMASSFGSNEWKTSVRAARAKTHAAWLPDFDDEDKPLPLAWMGSFRLAPFDIEAWKRGDLREKIRIGALSWIQYGFGVPPLPVIFYR